MAEEKPAPKDWLNLSPDDPLYPLAKLLGGFDQLIVSSSKANFAANYKANGFKSAVQTLIQEQFDPCACLATALVTDVASAEEVSAALRSLLENLLDFYTPLLKDSSLIKELRLQLFYRLEHWKAEAYHRGLAALVTPLAPGAPQPGEAPPQAASVIAPNCAERQSAPAPMPTSQTERPSKTGRISGSQAQDNLSLHDRCVQKVDRHFARHGRDGIPPYSEFYENVMPLITQPEFAAWKRNDPRHCGKKKWAALDKAANRLS